MSGGARGPTGEAHPPPDWLLQSTLPLIELPANDTLVRIHTQGRSPIFFSPGDGRPQAGRFDSASGGFGVLYVAQSFEGAFAETVLRNPARRVVSLAEIERRCLAVLAVSRSVRLVRMHGPGLQALGVDNAITTGPYGPCGAWADALFAHQDRPDGIAYASRHDPGQLCVALFSRSDLGIVQVSDSVRLTDMLAEVAAVLRQYGKGLDR